MGLATGVNGLACIWFSGVDWHTNRFLQVLRDRSVPSLSQWAKMHATNVAAAANSNLSYRRHVRFSLESWTPFWSIKNVQRVCCYIHCASRSFLPLSLLNFFLHRLAGFFPESLLLVCGMGNKTLAHFFRRSCHHPAEVMRVRFQSAGDLAGKLHEG